MSQSKPSWVELADAAFARTVETVLRTAEQTGTPVIVWHKGAVREIDPRRYRAILRKRARRDGGSPRAE